ncbi:hypothetical protein [Allorhodopirellula solitaria]|uniref:Uncharacterized protein n=1 Tax=Allorhodopirellula solitaria TaxID=2527987 RepID=A0A5C5YIS5_9BACT|nr:hypothetical protein [Allorhodopirellula solitaria]TWT74759.1 hypothetical protein CA85_00440 [Allorhodopirellula solitaria]
MNPYHPTRFDDDTIAWPACRTSRTFVEAALVGAGMSLIAPLCNATYCDLILKIPFTTTIWEMLTRMVPLALLCVILAIGCSILLPQPLVRILSRHQRTIPVVTILLLYSIYFSMLGFGFMRGGIVIAGYYATYYALSPALIAGFGALIYIIVRPRQSGAQQKTGTKLSAAPEPLSRVFW